MKLKQSPFLHLVPIDEEYVALYNSLNLEVAFLKRSFIEQHQQGQVFIGSDDTSERILEQLKNSGSLLKSGLMVTSCIGSIRRSSKSQPSIFFTCYSLTPATSVADTVTSWLLCLAAIDLLL